ncbi:hypothetical protein EVAR_58041_1 [Eumeta japonica]|uniref:Uncharacterized protein n=1 Tax=Eumeta variegata TaxID=151549 RepID=A0A4C1Z1Z0_EUMVA|nr:hypothetical protein EVAR_58041_1 [Eumeta japonica]
MNEHLASIPLNLRGTIVYLMSREQRGQLTTQTVVPDASEGDNILTALTRCNFRSVRFRRGSLRKDCDDQGRQRVRTLPSLDPWRANSVPEAAQSYIQTHK